MESSSQEIEESILKETTKIHKKISSEIFRDFETRVNLSISRFGWLLNKSTKYHSNCLLNKLSSIPLSPLSCLVLWQKDNQQGFNKFLDRSSVNWISESVVRLDVKKKKYGVYERKILRVLPSVMERLVLGNCIVNKNQFRKIIQAGRHIPHISFKNCDLSIDNLKFSNSIQYSIKYIGIKMKKNNEFQSPTEILRISQTLFLAASSTDLKLSMKGFYTDISEAIDQIRENAIEFGFHKLSIPNYPKIC
ncbi:unnamed protein product [Moneuplotes crassus]|uniref:Uncharacterized protein n=1 Tax=Euplotes crassus TaxID=5936 RepID=A0AAD1UND6_EUPCR|nr:unnamed protein product [Moneuplotes crassus]